MSKLFPQGATLAFILSVLLRGLPLRAEQFVGGRRSLVFDGLSAKLVIDLSGGSIRSFQLRGRDLNPLSWAVPPSEARGPLAFGHFLCLDRWGPPSDAEGSRGMPYHGEAAHVEWQSSGEVVSEADSIRGEMTAKLPLAGLSVKRTIHLSRRAALFTVREEVTNDNRLGRVYNIVQHPTIAPPFLEPGTVVDCNGRKGFAQGGSLPDPEEPSFYWPSAINRNGATVNLRYLTNDPDPNVVSYTIDEEYGWVTAATPSRGLLIGYVWRTKDYPWVSLWRDTQNGQPSARGLEFGTTGLHQPYPILVRKNRIFGRPLLEYLDAGETVSKFYAGLLAEIPSDYAGVSGIEVKPGRLILHERAGGRNRDISLETDDLLLERLPTP